MQTCKSCGTKFDWYHRCNGYVIVRPLSSDPLTEALPEPEQDPGYGDIPSRILWNVQQLRKEVAELRRERGPVQAFSAHWAEHD